MKQTNIIAVVANTAASIIIKHDAPDEKYSVTAQNFPPLATL